MALTKYQATILEKGAERFRRYQSQHKTYFGAPVSGRILDFGCGAGGFILNALKAGFDAWGIEVDKEREEQFDYITKDNFPQWRDRFHLYSGRLMPYPSKYFDHVYSWFVFEHVSDPQTSLREIVRTLKPGGTVYIQAEDVRNNWEGHALVPWPAYLPREFAAAYLEGLGKPQHADFVTNHVVYVSAPILCEILTNLGMEIVYANPAPTGVEIPEGLYVTSEEQARTLGERMRERPEIRPRENLSVAARKPLE